MFQSLFVLSDAGEVILEKQWSDKGGDRSICAWYWEQRREVEAGTLPSGSFESPTIDSSPYGNGLGGGATGALAPDDGMDEVYLRDSAGNGIGDRHFDRNLTDTERASQPPNSATSTSAQESSSTSASNSTGSSGAPQGWSAGPGLIAAAGSSATLTPSQGLVLSAPRCYVLSLDSGSCEGQAGEKGESGGHVVFLATTGREMQPMVGLELLKLVESVLVSYLGAVTEDLLKDHFVTVYSLLDEILGFGMPLAPDLPLLKEIVPPPSVFGKVVDKITGGVGTLSTSSWASAGAPTSAAAAAGAAAAAAAAAAAPVSQFFASAQAAIAGGTPHASNAHAHSPTSSSSISSSGFGSNGQGPRTAVGQGVNQGSASGGSSAGGLHGLSSSAGSRGHTVVPWRRVPPRYMHNEITFEFREEIDVVVASDGTVRRADVFGRLMVACQLSGMPDLTLTFVNPSVLADAALHRCVRANVWASDRIISCVPPDGHFPLLNYRVKGVQAIPVTVKPQITFQDGEGRVSIMVSSSQRGGLPQQLHSHNSSNHNHSHNLQQSITDALSSAGGTSSKPVDSLSLTVHLPQSVATCDLTANVGSVLFDSVSKVLIWDIGRMPRDRLPCLSGSVKLQPGVSRPLGRPAITVNFRVVGAAVSGLRIESVGVQNETYFVHKGYKSCTQAARYQVRT